MRPMGAAPQQGWQKKREPWPLALGFQSTHGLVVAENRRQRLTVKVNDADDARRKLAGGCRDSTPPRCQRRRFRLAFWKGLGLPARLQHAAQTESESEAALWRRITSITDCRRATGLTSATLSDLAPISTRAGNRGGMVNLSVTIPSSN